MIKNEPRKTLKNTENFHHEGHEDHEVYLNNALRSLRLCGKKDIQCIPSIPWLIKNRGISLW